MIFIASCISTVYSHEDAAPGCYGAPHPQHDGDVAAQPAEEALGQVLARRHEDEVLVGHRGVVAGNITVNMGYLECFVLVQC